MADGRWGASFGLVFVACFLGGLAAFDLPGHDDSDEIVNQFYSDGGNRARVLIGSALFGASGLAFLGFATVLAVAVRRREAPGGPLGTLLVATGVAFMVLLFAFAAAQVPTYALSIDAFDEPQSPLTRATIPHFGYSLLLYALLAAAVTCAVVGVAVRRYQLLPGWVAWASFAAAGLLVFSFLFMPMFALPLWAVATSVAFWRARTGGEPAAAA